MRGARLVALMLYGAVIAAALAGCTPPPRDTLCVATGPIYLRAGAIEALLDWREERVAIAAHNVAWEHNCW